MKVFAWEWCPVFVIFLNCLLVDQCTALGDYQISLTPCIVHFWVEFSLCINCFLLCNYKQILSYYSVFSYCVHLWSFLIWVHDVWKLLLNTLRHSCRLATHAWPKLYFFVTIVSIVLTLKCHAQVVSSLKHNKKWQLCFTLSSNKDKNIWLNSKLWFTLSSNKEKNIWLNSKLSWKITKTSR